MPIINDNEFGKITIRRSARATQVRIRVAPDGTLRASLPLYAPIILVKKLLKTSRSEIREILEQAKPATQYIDGMQIGKSHSLLVKRTSAAQPKVSRHGQQIVAQIPHDSSLNDPNVSRIVRDAVISALKIEAKSYLPKRLSFLAQKYQLNYENVRFSHASGRWGSYSSSGTISLNIALMKLPFELIDYVIIHELCHTKQMNHSAEFWSLVETADPNYKTHRRRMKSETPTI